VGATPDACTGQTSRHGLTPALLDQRGCAWRGGGQAGVADRPV